MSARAMAHRFSVAVVALGISAWVGVCAQVGVAFVGHTVAPSGVFGETGSGNGQLSSPAGLAVDEATHDVYVADSANNRVQKFDAEGKYLSQFDGSESPSGQFSGPYGVAVDNSSGSSKGRVYVTDPGHSVVDAFDSAGKYLSQLVEAPSGAFSSLEGVAVDSVGNVWVYDSSNVDEFDGTGSFVAQFNTGRGTQRGIALDSNGDVYVVMDCGCVGKFSPQGAPEGEWGGGVGLAIDPSTDHVFLDKESNVDEYGPFGEMFSAPLQSFGTIGVSESHGIAVDGMNGTVYVSLQGEGKVAVFDAATFPDVATQDASNIQARSVTLNGTVNPDGVPVTTCEFQYGKNGAYDQSAPCSTNPGSGTGTVGVTADLSGLVPNETYSYRLVAGNVNGMSSAESKVVTTMPVLPTVGDSSSGISNITRTSAVLSGTVNPEHSQTSYFFLYGPTSAYGRGAAPLDTGAGTSDVTVSEKIIGLSPGTTYHYAIAASNTAGTAVGPDRTFTTMPKLPPEVSAVTISGLAPGAATVSGLVDSGGLPTSYEIDFGSDTTYSTRSSGEIAGSSQTVSLTMLYLQPGVTYHYRLVASNADGTVTGSDETFTTPGYALSIPQVLPQIATPAIAFPKETTASKPKAKHKPVKHNKHKKPKHKVKHKLKKKK